jgi:hypothetical protein
MHSPLHLYLRDLIQGNNNFATNALECDHAGGHEVRSYEYMSSTLDASIASLKDLPSLRESDRAGVYQCVKTENGGSGEKKTRKVRICCASSDRSLTSRGSANTLIHRRRQSGSQSRSRASPQARSQKRVFRAFDEDDSVSSLVSTSQQSLSAPPMSPSSTPMSPLSPPMSPSSPHMSPLSPLMSPFSPHMSPSSVMDAFSSSNTTDDVHRYKSTIRTMPKSGLSQKRSSKLDALSGEHKAGLMKMPNISH